MPTPGWRTHFCKTSGSRPTFGGVRPSIFGSLSSMGRLANSIFQLVTELTKWEAVAWRYLWSVVKDELWMFFFNWCSFVFRCCVQTNSYLSRVLGLVPSSCTWACDATWSQQNPHQHKDARCVWSSSTKWSSIGTQLFCQRQYDFVFSFMSSILGPIILDNRTVKSHEMNPNQQNIIQHYSMH